MHAPPELDPELPLPLLLPPDDEPLEPPSDAPPQRGLPGMDWGCRSPTKTARRSGTEPLTSKRGLRARHEVPFVDVPMAKREARGEASEARWEGGEPFIPKMRARRHYSPQSEPDSRRVVNVSDFESQKATA